MLTLFLFLFLRRFYRHALDWASFLVHLFSGSSRVSARCGIGGMS